MDKKEFIMKPTVSIIVPVYNSERTVSKCLDSLINQTYKEIEIICVNDCSKDGSLNILKKYAKSDERIIIINHTENKNAGGARNSGIKSAKGEYICLVDNDDWLVRNAIELLIKASENGNADLVACDWVTYYSEDKQYVNRNLPNNINNQEIITYICRNGFRELGCLFKKGLFTKNKLFYPEKIFFEDNAIGLTLLCYCKIIKYVQKPLYYYLISTTSVTGFTSIPKIHDRITTSEMHISNLNKHGFYSLNKDWFDFVCLKLCYWTLYMLANYSYKDAKYELKRNIDLINRLLPNAHLNELNYIQRFSLKNPQIAFHILLRYPYSKLLILIYRIISKLKRIITK